MISLDEALSIHEVLIREFGGSTGLRDKGLLQAALERPYSGFGDIEFYPGIEQKAASIIESIVQNHPFVDGNKRTGYVLMRLLLLEAGVDIVATQDEKYDFVISIATGQFSFEQIVHWLKLKRNDVL